MSLITTKNKFNILKNLFNPFKIKFNAKMKYNFNPQLKGIKLLSEDNKSLFNMEIEIPAIKIPKNSYSIARKILRTYAFDSVNNYKKYQDIIETDPLSSTHKYMLLDPEEFKLDDIDEKTSYELINLLKPDENDVNLKSLIETLRIKVGYDELKFDDIIKAVIPDNLLNDNVNVKGYSIIGHIAHFNLRDKILDYKNVIGQALLDKMPQIKTVVNKLNSIDNTYRNFSFEILAGANDTKVQVKENGCIFRFDFAKVYWNPRLGTEHERIVNMLNPNDVVYDVFAGVGPFSIPAITKRKISYVISNDLNPESYRSLLENYKSNNKSKTKQKQNDIKKLFLSQTNKQVEQFFGDKFQFNPLESFIAFNLDGREFIKTKLKYHLIELIKYRQENKSEFGQFYILMNLPAMSIEFLDAFKNLYDLKESIIIRSKLDHDLSKFNLNIYCYHFAKSEKSDLDAIKQNIAENIFKDEELVINTKFVRKVAPNKDMYCSTFSLSFQKHLLENDEESKNEKESEKRKCTDENLLNSIKIARVDE